MKRVVASWDPGDELLQRVASWPWVAARLRGCGVQPVIKAMCTGCALRLWSTNRRAPRVIEVTVSAGTSNHYTMAATTPLVAAVLACWLARRHQRAEVPELDELVTGALSRGEVTAAALGTSWGCVEE